ncbi:MAG: ECF transporter S component [Candidatus Woesearchaeota archaeon]
MEYKNLFSFDIEWNYKKLSLFIFLLALPNLLGIVNIGTVFGFKIHLFQIAIFLAAMIYGPTGGFLSGLIGSSYSAFIMGNPYIAIGNAILGFFAGLFLRYGIKTVLAVLLAYAIQLPWLVLTDYYLVGLSAVFIQSLAIALLVSNLIWAVAVDYIAKQIKPLL